MSLLSGIDRARLFRIFKWSVYALLGVDVVLFWIYGGTAAVIDQLGWLLLIATFEYETSTLGEAYASRWQKWGIHALRLIAYAMILDAAVEYYLGARWLDLTNAVTWLLVCAVLEYDVYVPGEYGSGEWRVRNAVKALLYGILVACAVAWGIRGDLLDTYDAILWILCFGVVELNIFRFEEAEEQTGTETEPAEEPAGPG